MILLANKFNWVNFFKIAFGIFLAGIGIIIGGNSQGKLTQLVLGVGLASVGVALLVSAE